VIATDVRHQRDAFATAFRQAKPFRHVVIENFLEPEWCRRVLDDFPRFEDIYARNEMNEIGGKAVRTNVRDISPVYREVDRYLQTREFLDFVSHVTGIPDLLYDPDYIGGGTHENRDGQKLDQHVDFNFHPGTRWHRRLNLIVYLNPEWHESWGGNLQLQADPWNGDTNGPTIAPLFNRAVIFETTERSWHGFDAIRLPAERKDLSRKSFAIYLYTKERPADETAASHATVYVPEGMPAGLTEGAVLTHAHVDDLRHRFEHLRGQLKFLYEREKKFAEQIVAVEDALTQTRQAVRVTLQGYATQDAPAQGLWPDGWVGAEFRVEFTVTRKTRSFAVTMWVPPQLAEDQEFEIAIDDKRWNHRIAPGKSSTVTLALVRAAGERVALHIRARQTFAPNQDGTSQDDRNLAWRLISAVLEHK
jgi:2OG-Fe(II) oxygenase superfamily